MATEKKDKVEKAVIDLWLGKKLAVEDEIRSGIQTIMSLEKQLEAVKDQVSRLKGRHSVFEEQIGEMNRNKPQRDPSDPEGEYELHEHK
jgi:predicted RNA binding protein with dsRBD fold (UPF0201 family)